MSKTTRIVLGEGYGIGKGIVEGGLKWVGLTCHPESSLPVVLKHDDIERVVCGVVRNPHRRRRFRLVLEVVIEPTPRPPAQHRDVLPADDAQPAGGA